MQSEAHILLSGTEIIDKYRNKNSKTERIVGKTIEPETGEEIKKSNNVIQKKKRKSGGQERKKGDERKGKLQVQVGMVTTEERFLFIHSFMLLDLLVLVHFELFERGQQLLTNSSQTSHHNFFCCLAACYLTFGLWQALADASEEGL